MVLSRGHVDVEQPREHRYHTEVTLDGETRAMIRADFDQGPKR